jgi:hypothetical protein
VSLDAISKSRRSKTFLQSSKRVKDS